MINNDFKLSFEILNKVEQEDQTWEPYYVEIESPSLKTKVEELKDYLKKPISDVLDKREDWQMTVDVPKNFTEEILESSINTDALFCYLALQHWINNYGKEEGMFLFSRPSLKAGFRVEEQAEMNQLVLIFHDTDLPHYDHSGEGDKEKEPQEEKSQKVETPKHSEKAKTFEKSRFMQQKDKTLRKTAYDMVVPKKYDNIRKPPQEVPLDLIRKLFLKLDQDMDDRVSVEEIRNYIRKMKLTLEDEVADQMFNEIAQRRAVIHERQRNLPLTLDEVVAAIRGRHKWNIEEKKWDVTYRPMREYWIILLKTISDKVFAIPLPQVKPEPILAQFELNEMMMDQKTKKKAEGTVKRYHAIKDVKEPVFKRSKCVRFQ